MSKRVVVSELLDHLPYSSPDAIRSRRDLWRINFLMGNTRWVRRTVKCFRNEAAKGITEIGAGSGELCNFLQRDFPDAEVSAFDLIHKPPGVAPSINWQSGDLLSIDPVRGGGILVANLFLHHFGEPELLRLGKWMANFEVAIFNEPDRAKLPHLLGKTMHPWINHVTKHDMHVSIDAGFATGEIQRFLGLEPTIWNIDEKSTWRGARRVIGWRN